MFMVGMPTRRDGFGVLGREVAPGMERDKEGVGDLAGDGAGGESVGRGGCLRMLRGGVGATLGERAAEDGEDIALGPMGRAAVVCMSVGRKKTSVARV